jgi:hypothetical protein
LVHSGMPYFQIPHFLDANRYPLRLKMP